MQILKTFLFSLISISIVAVFCLSIEGTAIEPEPSPLQIFISNESQCHGRVVEAFTEANAGGSVREYPASVLDSKHPLIQNTSFTRCVERQGITDIQCGIENADLKNGLRLIIHNSGWESFSLAYLFVFPTDTSKAFSVRDRYQKSAELMALANSLSQTDSISKGFSADAVHVLQKQAKAIKPQPIQSELSIRKGDIPTDAWISRTGTIDSTHRYVEIVVRSGPL
jgi:hypothetical protein